MVGRERERSGRVKLVIELEDFGVGAVEGESKRGLDGNSLAVVGRIDSYQLWERGSGESALILIGMRQLGKVLETREIKGEGGVRRVGLGGVEDELAVQMGGIEGSFKDPVAGVVGRKSFFKGAAIDGTGKSDLNFCTRVKKGTRWRVGGNYLGRGKE